MQIRRSSRFGTMAGQKYFGNYRRTIQTMYYRVSLK
jgi:hypothetical protein